MESWNHQLGDKLKGLDFFLLPKDRLIIEKDSLENLQYRDSVNLIGIPAGGMKFVPRIETWMKKLGVSYTKMCTLHGDRFYDTENPQEIPVPSSSIPFILIDDTIASGNHLKRIYEELEKRGFDFANQQHYFAVHSTPAVRSINMPNWWLGDYSPITQSMGGRKGMIIAPMRNYNLFSLNNFR